MSDIEFGVISGRSTYRRTSSVNPPNQRSIWHDAHPVSRPVEDMVLEYIDVQPDPLLAKAHAAKLTADTLPLWEKERQIRFNEQDDATPNRKQSEQVKAAKYKANLERQRIKRQQAQQSRIEREEREKDPVYIAQKEQEAIDWLTPRIIDRIKMCMPNLRLIQQCVRIEISIMEYHLKSGAFIIKLSDGELYITWDDTYAYITLHRVDINKIIAEGSRGYRVILPELIKQNVMNIKHNNPGAPRTPPKKVNRSIRSMQKRIMQFPK